MSEIQTKGGGCELVEKALRILPMRVAAPLLSALKDGKAKKLTSKQTNLVVAVVNKEVGRQIVTLDDVARQRNGVKATATSRGCLDPCEGIAVGELADLVTLRMGGA